MLYEVCVSHGSNYRTNYAGDPNWKHTDYDPSFLTLSPESDNIPVREPKQRKRTAKNSYGQKFHYLLLENKEIDLYLIYGTPDTLFLFK